MSRTGRPPDGIVLAADGRHSLRDVPSTLTYRLRRSLPPPAVVAPFAQSESTLEFSHVTGFNRHSHARPADLPGIPERLAQAQPSSALHRLMAGAARVAMTDARRSSRPDGSTQPHAVDMIGEIPRN